jgi:hypothetical protein
MIHNKIISINTQIELNLNINKLANLFLVLFIL